MKETRTPVSEAGTALGLLDSIWDGMCDSTGGEKGVFIEKIFGSIWDAGTSGRALEEEFNAETNPEEQRLWILDSLMIACGYAADTFRAHGEKRPMAECWALAVTTAYWTGNTRGAWAVRSAGTPAQEAGRRGADKTHAENRALKKMAFSWLDAHRDEHRTMDDVADALRKVVPMTFGTTREWVSEWKKLRSGAKR